MHVDVAALSLSSKTQRLGAMGRGDLEVTTKAGHRPPPKRHVPGVVGQPQLGGRLLVGVDLVFEFLDPPEFHQVDHPPVLGLEEALGVIVLPRGRDHLLRHSEPFGGAHRLPDRAASRRESERDRRPIAAIACQCQGFGAEGIGTIGICIEDLRSEPGDQPRASVGCPGGHGGQRPLKHCDRPLIGLGNHQA